jgi:acetyl esterase/lipase
MTDEWLETIDRIVMVGHSCGAHILSHLVFGLPTSDNDASGAALRPALASLMRKTTGLAFLDGIYNVAALATEYPSYRFFIDAAFGNDPISKWTGADVFGPDDATTPPSLTEIEGVKKIIIAHATADELLTPTQGKLFLAHLRRIGLGEVAEWDEETLKGTHDGCLHERGIGELLYRLLL